LEMLEWKWKVDESTGLVALLKFLLVSLKNVFAAPSLRTPSFLE